MKSVPFFASVNFFWAIQNKIAELFNWNKGKHEWVCVDGIDNESIRNICFWRRCFSSVRSSREISFLFLFYLKVFRWVTRKSSGCTLIEWQTSFIMACFLVKFSFLISMTMRASHNDNLLYWIKDWKNIFFSNIVNKRRKWKRTEKGTSWHRTNGDLCLFLIIPSVNRQIEGPHFDFFFL